VVADAFARVEVDGRPYDVEPFVPGRPLHEGALDEAGRRAVLGWVARGLKALHDREVGHGAVASGVRLVSDGSVRLVGARRGSLDEDAGALEAVALQLWDEIPADVAERLEHGVAAWASGEVGFLPPVEPQEPLVQPHALAGQSFSLGAASPVAASPTVERPAKVQVAMVAGLTLVLGLLAGAMLGGCGPSGPPGPPPEVTVKVPGAIQVSVFCGGDTTYRTEGPNVDTLVFEPGPADTTHCEIEAPLSPVMPLRGTLTLSRAWSYRCDRDGVVLACRDDERPSSE